MTEPRPNDPAVRPRIAHVAVWTADVERLVAFYTSQLHAEAGPPYRNPKTGLRTVFLAWPGSETRLAVMTRPDVTGSDVGPRHGYAHLALAVGEPEDVDRMASTLTASGIGVASQPRWTGDGYYEAVVLDPDGNPVELVAG